MMAPKVSVVMGVYNDCSSLGDTIESILNQTLDDFEFIIVNDGSTDSSQQILDQAKSSDPRIRIITQENLGLTQALITGCGAAKGEFIARQDNGDISLPDRLQCELEYLEQHPKTSMVSCGTVFIAPRGEELYTVIQSAHDATYGLTKNSVQHLKGPPHHGSVMFRRGLYNSVGGYRAAFKIAQDIDLWTRLIEVGTHCSLPRVMYRASVAKNSISMLRRGQQLQATQAIIDCKRARYLKGNDKSVITNYISRAQKAQSSILKNNKSDAAYYYFVGSNLTDSNPLASSYYLRLAIKHNQWHIKARIKLATNLVKNHFAL
jgi:glycosyltransferase involved in cell wall biosynthesis